MELTLQRTKKCDTHTMGILSIEGIPFCDTLEPGQTAIPKGRYPVFVTRSEKFGGAWLPLLLHVPGFEGIRIHAGNTVEDTEGCILVGHASPKYRGRLFDSRQWLQRLMERLNARPEGEMMWITVK